jgi:hypothetical protein
VHLSLSEKQKLKDFQQLWKKVSRFEIESNLYAQTIPNSDIFRSTSTYFRAFAVGAGHFSAIPSLRERQRQ